MNLCQYGGNRRTQFMSGIRHKLFFPQIGGIHPLHQLVNGMQYRTHFIVLILHADGCQVAGITGGDTAGGFTQRAQTEIGGDNRG